MKVKAGKDVTNLIELAYKADKPVLLDGKHGVGKSEIIEQSAKNLGIDCIVRDLSLMEPPELIGLPRHDNGVTRYSPPAFLPTSGKGLLVFEELNRCEKYMMAPCLQLLTARRLNDYVLPRGWLPVAAVNPNDSDYDVNNLDPALLSRFMHIEIVADTRQWIAWAERNSIHASVCRFVRNTPDIFESACPRSFKYVSDIMHGYEQDGCDNIDLLTTAISGFIGEASGVSFVQNYLSGEEPLSAEIILSEDYSKHRKAVQAWTKSKRMDLLNASTHNVLVALQDSDIKSKCLQSDKIRISVEDFCRDMPADLAKKIKKALK